MKLRNIILSVVMATMIAISAVSLTMASTTTTDSTVTLAPNQQSSIFGDVRDSIVARYGALYSLSNFQYEFQNEYTTDGTTFVNLTINVNMKLTRPASDSAYIKALNKKLSTITDTTVQAMIQQQIDAVSSGIDADCYNVDSPSVFLYAISFPQGAETSSNQAPVYALYSRIHISDGNDVLSPVDTAPLEDPTTVQAAADDTFNSMMQSLRTRATTAVTYYRLNARDYATAHATDVPEFNSSNGMGSDCANFVSKCLNAGGFPVDTANSWYPATTYGNNATCGTNWMRTGFNNNGGVVPYMANKGYFALQTDLSKVYAGCIMSLTSSSHVTLVTYGDTVTIKYTQHSDYTETVAQSTNIVYTGTGANFYMPTSLVSVVG